MSDITWVDAVMIGLVLLMGEFILLSVIFALVVLEQGWPWRRKR